MEIKSDNLLWTYDVKPELYSKPPAEYMVRSKDYGLYSKKEAEIITAFLRRNLANIIYDIARLN